MLFAQVNGITMHYQTIGGPEGRPVVVFVNSLGTDFRIWRDVVVGLAGAYAVLTYDKRGHGLTDAPPAPYKLEDHVADLAALLDSLEINSAVVCGVSVGGLIAQGLYRDRPDLVQGLILCDTAHKIGTEDLWESRIAQTRSEGLEAMADGVMERWFTKDFFAHHAPAVRGYRNMLARQSAEGYAGTCAALRDADLTEAAEHIAVPVTCVVGDQDVATSPDMVRGFSELIPAARFQTIENAGHLPGIEQPEAMIALIKEFMSGLPEGRG